jgi:hypothetical protein
MMDCPIFSPTLCATRRQDVGGTRGRKGNHRLQRAGRVGVAQAGRPAAARAPAAAGASRLRAGAAARGGSGGSRRRRGNQETEGMHGSLSGDDNPAATRHGGGSEGGSPVRARTVPTGPTHCIHPASCSIPLCNPHSHATLTPLVHGGCTSRQQDPPGSLAKSPGRRGSRDAAIRRHQGAGRLICRCRSWRRSRPAGRPR